MENKLTELYKKLIGTETLRSPYGQRVMDVFEQFCASKVNFSSDIESIFTNDYPLLSDFVLRRSNTSPFFLDPAILIVYWMLIFHRNKLIDQWPLPMADLKHFASDLGVKFWR